MAREQRHLHPIDPDTGEITCPECLERQRVLDELTRKYHGALAQIGRLRNDTETEARRHALWPQALAHHDYWRDICNHPRSEFTAERFWLCERFVRADEEDGTDYAMRAIEGAAFDPMTRERRNGTVERYDSWELIFRDRGKFESFVSRAPRFPRRPRLGPVEHAREVARFVLERARLIESESDPVAVARLLAEIDRRNLRWLRS